MDTASVVAERLKSVNHEVRGGLGKGNKRSVSAGGWVINCHEGQ